MFKLISPFSKAKAVPMFFSNTYISSFSSISLKEAAAIRKSRVFSSNIPLLQSSFGPGGRRRIANSYKYELKSLTDRFGIPKRSDTWKRYNRHYGNTQWDKLKGPALFTLLFCTTTTLAMPYLFEYTPLGVFKRQPYALVLSIIAINGGVFLMWKAPQFRRYLNKYALIYKDNVETYWSFLGAAFSHQSFGHLFVNMFVLHSFGTTLCTMLGSANFLALYLNSAVISSFISILIPVLLRFNLSVGALGASGAIFSVFGAFSYLIPKAPIALFFFPIPGGSWIAFLGAAAYNVAGIAFKFGRYDYAAHLGGAIAGVAYGWWYDNKRKQMRRQRRVAYV
ncbi:rhomboid protein 1, mitochondrial [[Candida] railenensis]|uniref:Rhomboid protein 1, mitochondrial n=1 Tax=[Candida] railenensis TaxID=45579 RepID=A0A9P0QQK0_9ASCO|nr:rhomboid protein 1, mitochondrial [[Candida] railenensis]